MVREDAFITFVADTLFVERANTIVMIFAGFAFVALVSAAAGASGS